MKEVEKLSTKARIKGFMKKYGYYCLLAVAIVGLSLTIAIVNANTTQNTDPNGSSNVNTDAIVFAKPVDSSVITMSYSDSELQFNETLNCWRGHFGIDFKADSGSNVFAVYEGTIKSIETDSLNGTVITISHKDGLETQYGSLSSTVSVGVGDSVYKGQIIGKVSDSAMNEYLQGAHVHFEVLQNGANVDPTLYVSAK